MSRGPRVTTSNRFGERRGSIADLARRHATRAAKIAKEATKVTQTFETAIQHKHADGTVHAHGGSDNRGLDEFLRSVGQIKEGDTRPDETLGDEQHGHSQLDGSQSTGQVIWSQRTTGIDLATFEARVAANARAEKDEADSIRLDALRIDSEPMLDRNDPEDVATMNAIRAGIGLAPVEEFYAVRYQARFGKTRRSALQRNNDRLDTLDAAKRHVTRLTTGDLASEYLDVADIKIVRVTEQEVK